MNLLVAQCGGPTPVVNASLAAVISTWQTLAPHTARLWGCRLGLQGLATGNWTALDLLSPAQLIALRTQPAAALGSSRYRLQPQEIPAVLARLQAQQIDALLLIGGNGAMAAALVLSEEAMANGSPLRVLGIPKTIDNDIFGTHVAPGFASAAYFIAETVHNIGLDLYAMRAYDDVAVLEVMGRHSGWLAAASVWARHNSATPPHLILVPELAFDKDGFLDAVRAVHREQGVCLVVAAEGVRAPDGGYLAEFDQRALRDPSGQRMLGMTAGVAAYLAQLVRAQLGLLCRQLRPDTIQRSSRLAAMPVDRTLAELVGNAAVHAAFGGKTGQMVTITRSTQSRQDPAMENAWRTQLIELAAVAGRERPLPSAYLLPNFDIHPAMFDYLTPLLGERFPSPVLL